MSHFPSRLVREAHIYRANELGPILLDVSLADHFPQEHLYSFRHLYPSFRPVSALRG